MHDQTQQLNTIVDDLNAIEFTMKKASKVIADIGKGIMTDRCAGSGRVGSRWSMAVHAAYMASSASECSAELHAASGGSSSE